MYLTPLKITAHTPAGFAASDPWSPSLDGILAYWFMRDQLGEEAFALGQGRSGEMHPVTGLPLDVVEWQDWWWYAASAPITAAHGVYERHYHRRFDAQHERYLDMGERKSTRVQTNAGPYKNYRRSVRVQHTPSVVWHVVGDAEAIRQLLTLCTHIGHKSAQGYGHVSAWAIEPSQELHLPYHHRPLPVDYAESVGLPTEEQLTWGLRPPGRLAENQCLCAMPH